jgi:hypothetical protein
MTHINVAQIGGIENQPACHQSRSHPRTGVTGKAVRESAQMPWSRHSEVIVGTKWAQPVMPHISY